MSETKKVNIFNINPLVIEVEDVIKKGLNKILADYMDRYELLENTHKQIMRLPSIRQELNKHPYDSYSDDETETYEQNGHTNSDFMTSMIADTLDHRLRQLEKKYDTIAPVLDKILNKIISLDEDVKTIRSQHISSVQNTNSSNTHVKENEHENIQINFEEPSEDDEGDHPALITCSTITLDNEKDVSNDKTTENVEIEEDDELSVGEELGEHEEPIADEEQPLNEEVVEEEASIETETKSDVEEEEEEEEEEQEELEPECEPPKTVVEEKPIPEDEDDEELFEIEIDDKTYCTNNDQNGFIWELTDEGEQGEKIGYFEAGDAYFYEDEN